MYCHSAQCYFFSNISVANLNSIIGSSLHFHSFGFPFNRGLLPGTRILKKTTEKRFHNANWLPFYKRSNTFLLLPPTLCKAVKLIAPLLFSRFYPPAIITRIAPLTTFLFFIHRRQNASIPIYCLISAQVNVAMGKPSYGTPVDTNNVLTFQLFTSFYKKKTWHAVTVFNNNVLCSHDDPKRPRHVNAGSKH